MATFAKAAFDIAAYGFSRPTYPLQLFEFIFRYHERTPGALWHTAVDLGCGTGQATVELTKFRQIIGVDPSASMLENAREHTKSLGIINCEYVQSPAENLDFLQQDGSVDLVTAAQAAHWFDFSKVWPALARILRPGGSVAFWVYSEWRLTRYPALTPLITFYTQGRDPVNSLGSYWQRPGRTILENHLLDVPAATDVVPGAFTDWQRVFFTGSHYPDLPDPLPVILHKRMTWDELLAFLHTQSSLHTYHEKYPEDRNRPDGDIAERFVRQLKEGTGEACKGSDPVDVEWPLALILVKKS